MKVIVPLISLAILGMVAYVVVAAEEAAKTEVSVKGEVVDLHCFLTAGARGPDHKACAIACAKAGNPIGLVDDKGSVYLLLGKDNHKPNEAFIDKMAQTVTVKGELVKKGSLEAIVVSKIE